MKIGNINKLKVNRKTDIGYMLSDGSNEVFLHFNESKFQDLKDNDTVEAFLYYDSKGRLSATLHKPLITTTNDAFLKVVDVKRDLGVFVDMGISKDLLVSKDDLPLQYSLWPEIGDVLYLRLVHKNRLTGKPLHKSEIPVRYDLEENTHVLGYVIKTSQEGLDVLTLDLACIFIHHTQTRKPHRLGEKVEVKVIRAYEHTLNGSLIKQKENQMDLDAKRIYEYLRVHKQMPLGNHSSPEAIFKTFHLSKKAFKRALGILYRERLIHFEGEITKLGEKDE
ncbi:MAG: S1-like domain-containing RNA-binding protein [Acholeplasmataceae bacterium]